MPLPELFGQNDGLAVEHNRFPREKSSGECHEEGEFIDACRSGCGQHRFEEPFARFLLGQSLFELKSSERSLERGTEYESVSVFGESVHDRNGFRTGVLEPSGILLA